MRLLRYQLPSKFSSRRTPAILEAEPTSVAATTTVIRAALAVPLLVILQYERKNVVDSPTNKLPAAIWTHAPVVFANRFVNLRLTLLRSPQPTKDLDMTAKTFQLRVREWVSACFPIASQFDREERTHRFLEEALELAQAHGCTKADALALIEYVFSRPEGEPLQETGGVLVTLAALSNTVGIDMEEAGERELERNWSRIDKIRAKQASKPQGSALPQ